MVGRETEVKELNRLYDRNRAELIAVYGRRRVGKTYLIDETFAGRFTFRHAGLSPEEDDSGPLLDQQLLHFYNSLRRQGMKEGCVPENWLNAFYLLEDFLEERDDGTRQLVFLDELPWMDTPKSGFLKAFEGFWNNWGCHRKNLMVIVCGSANSWIMDKMINDHGGLYNRVTYEIKLLPFTLSECEEYYQENDIRFSRYDITQGYMIFGGIPYYMGYMNGELSLAQNIDDMFFRKNARLSQEFDRLFSSVFVNPEAEKKIVFLLGKRNAGYTRKEIAEKLRISDGGGLTRYLNALIASDFVIRYVPFGFSKREEHYKLTDPFCLFYLHFLGNGKNLQNNYWQQNITSQEVVSWRGLAFENVCFSHVEEIKKALGVSGVASQNSAWSKRYDDESGMQIDLLIARNDNVINMCEIKYYSGDFRVSGDYYKTILERQQRLYEMVPKKTSVRSTLVTTFGLAKNEYSGAFTNVITLDDLFCHN